MINQATLFALAASITALPGCAQGGAGRISSAAAEGRQCFPVSAVSGCCQGREDNQIYVDVGPRDVYLFETFGPCPDLDFSWAIGFDVRPGNFICDALNVDLVLPQATIGPRRCPGP